MRTLQSSPYKVLRYLALCLLMLYISSCSSDDTLPEEEEEEIEVPEVNMGIEIRGASSQFFPKKSFGFETRDAVNEDLDVYTEELVCLNDWIVDRLIWMDSQIDTL